MWRSLPGQQHNSFPKWPQSNEFAGQRPTQGIIKGAQPPVTKLAKLMGLPYLAAQAARQNPWHKRVHILVTGDPYSNTWYDPQTLPLLNLSYTTSSHIYTIQCTCYTEFHIKVFSQLWDFKLSSNLSRPYLRNNECSRGALQLNTMARLNKELNEISFSFTTRGLHFILSALNCSFTTLE